MRIRLWALGLAGALAVGAAACYPDRLEDPGDYDSIVPIFDADATFSDNTTFFIPDREIHLVTVGETDEIDRTFDALILTKIRDNMVARGYTEVVDPLVTPPDVEIQAVVTATENTGYALWPWCTEFGWEYPWIGCSDWGIDFPSGVISYEYAGGTLVMQMLDLRGVTPGAGNFPATWVGSLNGVYTGGSTSEVQDRINDGINQAFIQSPYIEKAEAP
jgi:hypothetical protein